MHHAARGHGALRANARRAAIAPSPPKAAADPSSRDGLSHPSLSVCLSPSVCLCLPLSVRPSVRMSLSVRPSVRPS
eukprot:3809844-Alexandrium_andersonii.AAC.1